MSFERTYVLFECHTHENRSFFFYFNLSVYLKEYQWVAQTSLSKEIIIKNHIFSDLTQIAHIFMRTFD